MAVPEGTADREVWPWALPDICPPPIFLCNWYTIESDESSELSPASSGVGSKWVPTCPSRRRGVAADRAWAGCGILADQFPPPPPSPSLGIVFAMWSMLPFLPT